jgi:hypothetical protein
MRRTQRQLPPQPFDSDFDQMKPEFRSNGWFFRVVNSYRNHRDLWEETNTWPHRAAVLFPYVVVTAILVVMGYAFFLQAK